MNILLPLFEVHNSGVFRHGFSDVHQQNSKELTPFAEKTLANYLLKIFVIMHEAAFDCVWEHRDDVFSSVGHGNKLSKVSPCRLSRLLQARFYHLKLSFEYVWISFDLVA